MAETDKEPLRRVVLIKIYASERKTRTGTYPVGKHLRAEIRDAETDELIQKHAYSPFSTQRLRHDSMQRNEKIVRWLWDVETAKVEG